MGKEDCDAEGSAEEEGTFEQEKQKKAANVMNAIFDRDDFLFMVVALAYLILSQTDWATVIFRSEKYTRKRLFRFVFLKLCPICRFFDAKLQRFVL